MATGVLEGNGHRVTVQGRLQDGGPVTVEVDGDQHVIRRSDGRVDEGAVSVTLHGDGGLKVEEGAVSQEITLPDGTFIRRGAATDRAVLPDGTTLKSGPGDSENGAEIVVSMNGTKIHASSSSTTAIQHTTGDDVEVKAETSDEAENEDEESSSIDDVETPEAFVQAALAVFFGGLFAEPVFGVGPGLIGAVGIAGTLYYGLATAYHARGHTPGDADTVISGASHLAGFAAFTAGLLTGAAGFPAAIGAGLFTYFGLHAAHSGLDAVLPHRDDEADADLDDAVREELADLQAEYLDADGDVETIEEYEARVGELLDGEDVDPKDVEVERVPETETA